jgi:biotin operon repressor
MEQERLVKGLWIPIEIWKDTNLSWNEKILFLEIDSFTSADKDCYISNEYIAQLLGVSETRANKILSSLISKGYVIKTSFDGRKRYVKSALSLTTSQGCPFGQGRVEQNDNILNTITNTIDNNKKTNKKDVDEFVNRMYALYPAKCPMRNHSLGKSSQDKKRIAKLLKTYTESQIEMVIQHEIDEKYGKSYMQNFSTFLNNFPDPSCIDNATVKGELASESNQFIINGICYK